VGLAGLNIGNENGINQIVDNFDRAGRLIGSVYAQGTVLERLALKSQANVDYRTEYNESWSPGYTSAELGLPRESQDYNDSRGLGTSFVWTNTANFVDSIGANHINVLGGIELQQYQDRSLSALGQGFLSSDDRFYRVAKNAEATTVGGGAGESAFLGYLGRVSYDYAQKYLVTASVRRDGTSTFSPVGNRRWGTFPSVSAAWRLSEEPFFNLPMVDEFKLRGSWGELGNSQTAAYPYVTRVFVDPDYGLGGGTVKAPSPVNFVNEDLTWETQRITDFGIEAGLFNSAVTLSATYYKKDTRNFLVPIPLPAITGFGSVPVNAGSVRNTGLELEVGYTPQLGRDMRLSLSGNLTTVKNRLTAITPGIEEFTSGEVYRTAVGYPIGYIWGFKTDGIYQTPADAAAALVDKTTGGKKGQPGDLRFVDTNGPAAAGSPRGQQFSGTPDGQITSDDRTYLGKTIPDYYYGFSANGGWKGIDVALFFQGVGGVQIYNQFRRGAEGMSGGGRNQLASTQNRWTGPGTSNTMPRAVSNDPNANGRVSDRWVEDGSYLRLKNLQIGYTVPQRYVRNRVSTARVYVAGTNLLTFTNYTGLDPEVQTYGADAFGVSATTNQLGSGTDQGNIPQSRVFQLGLSLGF
jgi:TonB-linked SusC/RagA family outer membrane protein